VRYAALLLLLGCTSPARRETEQLSNAVDRFRRAENAEKPGLVAGIRDSACTDSEVCSARAVCLASAESTSKGLTTSAEAKQAIAAMKTYDETAAKVLEQRLDEAKKDLDDGMTKLRQCDDQLMALKRKHGV